MALRITIDIFSGRPNPVVELTGRQATATLERLTPQQALKGREARVPPPTLGYRGLIVEQIRERNRRAPPRFRVANGLRIQDGRVRPIADPAFEDFICWSTGPLRKLKLKREFFKFLERERLRLRERWHKWPWPPPRWPSRAHCRCAPLYEPDWWNDNGQRQWNNNCYNYGCDYRSDTFAQPGQAAGAMYSALTCASVRPAALKDDLIDSPNANNRCPGEGHLVALVVGPGWDFHWYRKGRNGLWTHKPGGTEVTNQDNAGALIPDPRTADRGFYTDFCTFMTVMHGHIKIQ
jgi:hypothetical protein